MTTFRERMQAHQAEEPSSLAATFPEIRTIETLAGLEDLQHTGKTESGPYGVRVHYTARAPTLLPAIRKKLLEKGIPAYHILSRTIEGEGTDHERYHVTLGFYGNKLIVVLTLRK